MEETTKNSHNFSALNCIRRSSKQQKKESRKIADKKYRLKKKHEMQKLKSILSNCPSCSMLLNAHVSCQISGQVSDQLPPQNGNPMQADQMQNLAGVPLDGSPLDIFAMNHSLLESAQKTDEYINPNTLGSLPSYLIMQPTVDSHTQRHVPLGSSSSSFGTIIPTSGMPHSGNSNFMSTSVDTPLVSYAGNDSVTPTVNTAGILPTVGDACENHQNDKVWAEIMAMVNYLGR